MHVDISHSPVAGMRKSLLVLILVSALALPYITLSVKSQYPPQSGDWIISDYVEISDQTFIINGSIIIEPQGVLVLRNSKLLMNGNGLRIAVYGNLTILGSEIAPFSGSYDMLIDGGFLKAIGSNITNPSNDDTSVGIDCHNASLYFYNSFLYTEESWALVRLEQSSSLALISSTFSGGALTSYGSNVTIIGSEIREYIYINNSTFLFRDSLGAGIQADSSSNLTIVSSELRLLECGGVTLRIENTTILPEDDDDALDLEGTNAWINNVLIEPPSGEYYGGGIILYKSSANVTNVTVKYSWDYSLYVSVSNATIRNVTVVGDADRPTRIYMVDSHVSVDGLNTTNVGLFTIWDCNITMKDSVLNLTRSYGMTIIADEDGIVVSMENVEISGGMPFLEAKRENFYASNFVNVTVEGRTLEVLKSSGRVITGDHGLIFASGDDLIFDGITGLGVMITDSSNVTVTSARLSGSTYNIGIYSSNVSISDCELTGASYGLHLLTYSNVTISNSSILSNEYGVYTEYMDYITIVNCRIENNTRQGMHCEGEYVRIVDSIVANNTGRGIDCKYNMNTEVLNCTITSNGGDGVIGIYNLTVISSNISYNGGSGIVYDLGEFGVAVIVNNTIVGNGGNGIYVTDSRACANISGNLIMHNKNYGVYLATYYCVSNVTYNDFIENGYQAYARSMNFFDMNYFSDYSGEDADFDCIGDEPYNITGGAIDHHPVMGPYRLGPKIWNVSWEPKIVYSEDNVTVEAVIRDPDGVLTAVLHYMAEQEGSVSMSFDAQRHRWIGTIPAFPEGTNVTFFIEASDGRGLTSRSDAFSYRVAYEEPPEFRAIWGEPPSPHDYDEVTIYIEVYDVDGVDSVVVSYTIDNETWYNITAAYNQSAGYWYAVIPGFPPRTTVFYMVIANDTRGNVAVSETYHYYVAPEDVSPPNIEAVEYLPTRPSDNESVEVMAFVSDDHVVVSVILSYSAGSGWLNVTMQFNETGGYWFAFIPPQPAGTSVAFRVLACDNSSNWATSDIYQYEVVELNPPRILRAGCEPERPTDRDEIVVYAEITDESGIVRVVAYVTSDGGTEIFEMAYNGSLYTATIGKYGWGTELTITILAEDAYNNTASVSISVAVEKYDTVPPRILSVGALIQRENNETYVTFYANVTDNVGLKSVRLHVIAEGVDLVFSMEYNGTVWRSTVQIIWRSIEYYVEAVDVYDNVARSEIFTLNITEEGAGAGIGGKAMGVRYILPLTVAVFAALLATYAVTKKNQKFERLLKKVRGG